MFFHIDPTNGLAIYEQVAREVVLRRGTAMRLGIIKDPARSEGGCL
jgi:hypothetical protein